MAAALICFALLLVAPTALALPSARLIFVRGAETASCPSESDVRSAVVERLGYEPFNSYAPATMFVEVGAEKDRFTARLRLVDPDGAVRGDRVLRAAGECRELMTALALTMSIAIDPESVTRTGPPPDAPPEERPVTALPTLSGAELALPTPTMTSPDALPPPKSSESVHLSMGILPLTSVGTAPNVAAGGALFVEAQRGLLVGGIEGRADLPSSKAVELGRVRSWLASGSLYAGVRKGPFFAAAVGTMGRLSATSTEVAASNDTTALFAGAGVLTGASVVIAKDLELRLRVELLANLTRHRLTISGQEAFRYPVASGNLGLGLAYRFW